MSTTILAVVINLLAVLLPKIGVHLPTEQLTDAAQTIVAVATGVWIWYRRVKRGDVNAAGFPKA